MASEKSSALAAFAIRKEANKGKKRIDNASLYAGSPMHYYCRLCGEEMTLPEGHRSLAPRYCDGCLVLIETGWVNSI